MRSKCPVTIFITKIVYCLGSKCIIRALCVVTSCLQMILIMRGGFVMHIVLLVVTMVIVVEVIMARGLVIIRRWKGIIGYRFLGRLGAVARVQDQVIMRRPGKKIWIENYLEMLQNISISSRRHGDGIRCLECRVCLMKHREMNCDERGYILRKS